MSPFSKDEDESGNEIKIELDNSDLNYLCWGYGLELSASLKVDNQWLGGAFVPKAVTEVSYTIHLARSLKLSSYILIKALAPVWLDKDDVCFHPSGKSFYAMEYRIPARNILIDSWRVTNEEECAPSSTHSDSSGDDVSSCSEDGDKPEKPKRLTIKFMADQAYMVAGFETVRLLNSKLDSDMKQARKAFEFTRLNQPKSFCIVFTDKDNFIKKGAENFFYYMAMEQRRTEDTYLDKFSDGDIVLGRIPKKVKNKRTPFSIQDPRVVFHDEKEYHILSVLSSAYEQKHIDMENEELLKTLFDMCAIEVPRTRIKLPYQSNIEFATKYLFFCEWHKLHESRPQFGERFQINLQPNDFEDDLATELTGDEFAGLNNWDSDSFCQQSNPVDCQNQPKTARWDATVVVEKDITPDGFLCFLVTRGRQPRRTGNLASRPFDTTIIPVTQHHQQGSVSLQQSIVNGEKFKVRLIPYSSRQLFKDEVSASAEFQSDESPEKVALRQFILGRAVSLTEGSKTEYNLLARVGPLNLHNHFRDEQVELRQQFSKIQNGILLIEGIAGSGKTTAVLTVAAELQSNIHCSNPFLYISACNMAVDDAAVEYGKICRKAKLNKKILRICSLPEERAAVFDYLTRRGQINQFKSRNGQSGLVGDNLVLSVVNREEAFLDRSVLKRKGPSSNYFLSKAMIKYLESNPADNRWSILRNPPPGVISKVDDVSTLNAKRMFNTALEALMELTIRSADAVFTTLQVAARVNLRGNKEREIPPNAKPHFIIIDDASKIREMSLAILFGYYKPEVYIMISDTVQLAPTVRSQPYGNLSDPPNLLYKQALLPLPERLKNLTHPMHSLNSQTRCRGNIMDLPNILFYHGKVKTKVLGEEDQAKTRSYSKYVADEYNIPSTNTMWVEVDGGKVFKAFNNISLRNPSHVAVVFHEIKKLLKRLGDGQSITVATFYSAQARQYENDLQQKRFLEDYPHTSIRVCTIDALQGHEDDIVFVDFVKDSGSRFIGDRHRLAVALTRARYLQICVGSSGMAEFINTLEPDEHDDTKVCLGQAYQYFLRNNYIVQCRYDSRNKKVYDLNGGKGLAGRLQRKLSWTCFH